MSIIRKLFFLEQEIKELGSALEEEINKWSSKQKDLLITVKGLSEKTINRFLAEIEDIKKFSSANKLIKYTGLDPVVKQSGK